MSPLNIHNIDSSWTLFLDRDGVINKRLPGQYVKHISDFDILPGVLETIAYFSKFFGRIIIVTNQQGIAKGLLSADDVHCVHDFLRKRVRATGGRIDRIYFCGDWADAIPNCRKPHPHMALQAQKDFPEIEFSKSIMVGDMPSDIAFGQELGMITIWVQEDRNHPYPGKTKPDFITNSLESVPTEIIPPLP